ncbi:hypothetical protein [Photobacterium aquimaris]|uniref:hypothetical protein n=1 Tax=Photobacterium aquimaris TaxID=512643 RepID=UPI000A41933C
MLLYSETFGVKTQASQPTLVFLHGLLGNGRDWRYVISSLRQPTNVLPLIYQATV